MITEAILDEFTEATRIADDYENCLHMGWRAYRAAFIKCRIDGNTNEEALVICQPYRDEIDSFKDKLEVLDKPVIDAWSKIKGDLGIDDLL